MTAQTNQDLMKTIIKCVNFAAIKHKDQRRKNPEKIPYINHPIGVAYILTEEANITDPQVIQAAILHDTVEDTDTTFDEIERKFGKKVRDIVAENTDVKFLPKEERKRLQIENATKLTYEARLVRLADKLYNLRDLEISAPEGWDQCRVNEYFCWAKKVTDQLIGTNSNLDKGLEEVYRRQKLL